jgi:hypothetical protein
LARGDEGSRAGARLRGSGLERPLGYETGKRVATADPLEEPDTLRLRSKCNLSARDTFQSKLHEPTPNAAALVLRVDEDFWDRREEITVGKNADTANQPVTVPCTDVDCARQRGCGFLAHVWARPDTLGERQKVVDVETIRESHIGHARELRRRRVGKFIDA